MALIEEYYGGVFFKTPQQEIYEEITQDAPRRQELLLALGEQQIAAQKAATKEIIQSNMKGAGIVATEIAQQTRAMETVVQHMGQEVSLVGERMSHAVEELGERLSGGLYELHWQVAQVQCQIAALHQTMKDILYVLRNSRNNEAQQLVKQGLRHYINEEYKEAEERFKRALQYDSTDYQVLMNLGFLEIHKNNAKQAAIYFDKALKLPENLDNLSKSRTLWAIARLYYTQKLYEKAVVFAETALKLDRSNPEGWFTCGIYAALAGKTELALKYIQQAIQLNPIFFSKAAAETQRDLQRIRQEVFGLLSKMADEMYRKAATACNDVKAQRDHLNATNWSSEYINSLNRIHTEYKQAVNLLQKPSYADCVRCVTNILNIQQAIPVLSELDRLYKERKGILEHLEDQKSYEEKLHRTLPEPKKIYEFNSGLLFLLAIICLYGIPGAYMSSLVSIGSAKPAAFLLWPLLFIFGAIYALIGATDNDPAFGSSADHFSYGLKGIAVAFIIIVVAYLLMYISHSIKSGKETLRERRRNKMLSDITETQAALSKLKYQTDNLEYAIRNSLSTVSSYLSNIRW